MQVSTTDVIKRIHQESPIWGASDVILFVSKLLNKHPLEVLKEIGGFSGYEQIIGKEYKGVYES